MITPEILRAWADESDDGEEIVLNSRVLRKIAEQLEYGEDTALALNEALERLS